MAWRRAGLSPARRQAITWTNDDPVAGDELNLLQHYVCLRKSFMSTTVLASQPDIQYLADNDKIPHNIHMSLFRYSKFDMLKP